jgi:type 1 glutamine amidotransferase
MGKRLLVLGGGETGYHNFAEIGPVYHAILTEAGHHVTLTEDLNMLLPGHIGEYDALVCCTTGRELSGEQEKGLLDAVAGRDNTADSLGFIGIHSASCSFLSSEPYLRMLGARFLNHPLMGPRFHFHVKEREHPVTDGITNFTLKDELYLFELYPPQLVLVTTQYDGFEVPVCWVKQYGLGRVFYLSLGHAGEQVLFPMVKRLIENAVLWVTKNG